MILRNLLKRSGIVHNELDYKQPGYAHIMPSVDIDQNYLVNIQLSAQLLQCCQTLYGEAHSVLYDENQLSVRAFTSGYQDFSCVVFDSTIYLPDIYNSNFEDEPCAMDQRIVSNYDEDIHNPPYQPTPEMPLLIAERFSHLRLTIHTDSSANDTTREIFSVCRLLRQFLDKKHVTLAALEGCDPGRVIMETAKFTISELLRGCRYLRCQSINFHGVALQETTELVKMITCDKPVHDVFEMQRALPPLVEQMSTWKEDEELLQAVYGDDYKTFEHLKQVILERARIQENGVNQDWIEQSNT